MFENWSKGWRMTVVVFGLTFAYSLLGFLVPMGTDLPLWSAHDTTGITPDCSGSVVDNWDNPRNRDFLDSAEQCEEIAHSQAARLGLFAGLSIAIPLAARWIRRSGKTSEGS